MAMTKSGAERQRAYRQRQAEENARLRLRAEIGAGFFNAAGSQKARAAASVAGRSRAGAARRGSP